MSVSQKHYNITAKMIEAAARSDATFDGRVWQGLGRADRERYLSRSAQALAAANMQKMVSAIGYAIPLVEKWCWTQGDNEKFHAETVAPLRDALNIEI